MAGLERYPIRFTGLNHLMRLTGMVPSRCFVEIDDRQLRVCMGPWFELDAPRDLVRGASLDAAPVLGWGVHGWRDRWLVNGSSSGMVRVLIEPSVRAWMGPVPLRVRVLRVSVEDPDGLVAALSTDVRRPGGVG